MSINNFNLAYMVKSLFNAWLRFNACLELTTGWWGQYDAFPLYSILVNRMPVLNECLIEEVSNPNEFLVIESWLYSIDVHIFSCKFCIHMGQGWKWLNIHTHFTEKNPHPHHLMEKNPPGMITSDLHYVDHAALNVGSEHCQQRGTARFNIYQSSYLLSIVHILDNWRLSLSGSDPAPLLAGNFTA